ncbi:hypothetical protein IH992_06505 [Candidatus Poribacteria bacterium]|nr:hypothetical protein [Candidatus Poribacteria bacterium]
MWDSIPVWVRLVQHAIFSLTIVGMVYSGFGFAIALTGEERWKIRHCGTVLAIAFVVKTILEILYRIFGVPMPWYGLVLFPACLFYMVLILFKFHIHAQTALPLTKWRMTTSKWALILCLLTPLDWWFLQPKTMTWLVRPSIIMAIVGWSLFALSSTMPPWFQRLVFLIEEGSRLMQQNMMLLSIVSELLDSDASRKVESCIRRFAAALRFSEIQTHTLVRAGYLKPLAMMSEETELDNFTIEMLSSRDVERIIKHRDDQWDGEGSSKLSGNNIPIESQVLALTEAFVFMLDTMSVSEAIAQIQTQARKRFAPRLVEELEKLFAEQEQVLTATSTTRTEPLQTGSST